MMNEKKIKDLNSFITERDQLNEEVHQMIKEAKLEQLSNQKCNGMKLRAEDAKKYERLREKAKHLIAKARQNQLDERSAKERNQIEEHSLSNLDASLFLPDLPCKTEKIFKSYRVKRVKDLPCIKKKLDSRLHDSWNVDEEEPEESQLNNSRKRTSRSNTSSIKSYFVNYELEDLEKELEKTDKEAYDLEITLRYAINNDGDEDLKEYYMKKWYESINKRNAAIQREIQLSLLENEKNLNNRYEMLNKELQTLVTIEESQKTDAQKTKEKLLLEELVEIVNKRSELVVHFDMNEQAFKEDPHSVHTQNVNQLNQEDEKNCFLM